MVVIKILFEMNLNFVPWLPSSFTSKIEYSKYILLLILIINSNNAMYFKNLQINPNIFFMLNKSLFKNLQI